MIVCVFEDRKYTNNIKQCIYKLLELNVSASNVTPVIETVLKIVNIEANQVPSKSTVLDSNLQRLFLAQNRFLKCLLKRKILPTKLQSLAHVTWGTRLQIPKVFFGFLDFVRLKRNQPAISFSTDIVRFE